MTVSDVDLRIAGDRWMVRNTDPNRPPTSADTATLAYHFYDTRGRQDGHDVEDRLLAERELARHYWLVEDSTAAE